MSAVSPSQPTTASDDIVQRLRHLAKLLGIGHFDIPARFNEAADEIECIRAQLASARKALEEMTQTFKPFTRMPVGAPNSVARADQDHEIAVHQRAVTTFKEIPK